MEAGPAKDAVRRYFSFFGNLRPQAHRLCAVRGDGRAVWWETMMPQAASKSSTNRRLRGTRK